MLSYFWTGGIAMDWIKGFQRSIDYIEEHICESADMERIAREMNISGFYYQKIFSIVCGFSAGEYIRNRRLALAGRELADCGGKIIDIALKYGYDTPEGFTRAFTRFHGASPTAVKNGTAVPKPFAKLSVSITVKGGSIMDHKIVKKDSFKVLERVEKHTVADSENINTIPEFWTRAHSDGTVKTLLEKTSDKTYIFGICYGNTHSDSKTFDYAIASVCSDDCEAPEGFRISEIPARTWAVFEVTGAMPNAIQEMWHRIITEFFPSSEYQPTYEMDIEAYPAGVMNSSDYRSEIWVPLADK